MQYRSPPAPSGAQVVITNDQRLGRLKHLIEDAVLDDWKA
jgi:hypothetical protein